MPTELLLSLILPIYNFETRLREHVEYVLKVLRGEDIPFELILVNDGSRDNSAGVLAELAQEHSEVKWLDNAKNRGKGHAVRQGVTAAQGQYIFFTDIDLSYGLGPVLSGMRRMMTSDADLMLGSRDLPESQDVVPYSIPRKVTKKVFSFLVNRVLGLGITDTQCGLKGFRKAVAKELFSRSVIDDFCFDVEILYLARESGKKIELMPVQLAHANSSFSLLSASFQMFGSLISLSVRILFNRLFKKPR